MSEATLQARLQLATIASCTCVTKTNDWRYHNQVCTFRLCEESITKIEALKSENENLRGKGIMATTDVMIVANAQQADKIGKLEEQLAIANEKAKRLHDLIWDANEPKTMSLLNIAINTPIKKR